MTNRGFSYTVLKQNADVDVQGVSKFGMVEKSESKQIKFQILMIIFFFGGVIVYVHWAPKG